VSGSTRDHTYVVTTTWTGNLGQGTAGYRSYARGHQIAATGKPEIAGSSDPAFRGDGDRWNPEELFVAALSACHMLWYLHLCSDAGLVVVDYADEARGEMVTDADGAGRFTRVRLYPRVALALAADADAATERERALTLHREAHRKCFIANSVSCSLEIDARVDLADLRSGAATSGRQF